MSLLDGYILGGLAVWRITHLMNAEDGPGQLLARLRHVVRTGVWGELLDCFYCLSLWIALPFALLLGTNWKERLLLFPALSGAAILLDRIHAPLTPRYFEDPGGAERKEDKSQ